ncbi:Coenzyme F420 hydrogenase/dehydrogenase, beta subunit C-terminal domain [Thermovibrio sp.]
MLKLNESFLLGKYKKVFKVVSTDGTPIETLFNLMFRENLIDGLLTYSKEEEAVIPKLLLKEGEFTQPQVPFGFGLNSLLKKAVQKYRLNKIAVFGAPCVLDGLNKTQYYGIGCNWTKTAIALKVGQLCLGNITKSGVRALLLHVNGKDENLKRVFIKGDNLVFQTENRKVEVPLEVLHKYILSACRYCLNLSSKGSDITFVQKERKNEGLFIIRSERGWYTVAKLQKRAPGKLKLKGAEREEVENLLKLLREKVLLNIDSIIDAVEVGLPVPKWSGNKLRKFYRLWNSIDATNFEEEVF